jgi:hypothetical protein
MLRNMRCLAAVVVCLLGLPVSSIARAQVVEVLLRDGAVVRGDRLAVAAGACALTGAGGTRSFAAGDVLGVLGTAVAVPPLPAAFLAGGDVLRGAIAGGDAAGNRLELDSPVLGRLALGTDRLAALAAPGVASPLQFRLPAEVAEGLFVRARIGFDLLAGTLHRFGERGVLFEPAGAGQPRWYRVDDFAVLRLRDAAPPEGGAVASVLTRLGDRLGAVAFRWADDGARCTIDGGTEIVVPLQDMAAVAFLGDAVFLSDLPAAKVEESGHDGEVLHAFQRDSNVLGGALTTAGRTAAKGLGVHARSRLTFAVPAGATRFWTRVGFDDSALRLGIEPRAAVRVLIDGDVAFEQPDLVAGQPPVDVGPLPVRGGGTLTLEVEPGRGRDLGDRINWLLPVFLPAGAKRP